MYIIDVRIENFRGIRKMELQLHPQLNVFIGNNGAGKSSVLDVLGYLLTPFAKVLSGEVNDENGIISHKGNDFPDFEIRNGELESEISCSLMQGKRYYYNYRLYSSNPPLLERETTKTQELYHSINNWLPIFRNVNGESLGILVYYRVHRIVEDVSIDAWTDRDFAFKDAFIDAMSPKTNFKEFFEWFRNREDLENEERTEDKQLSTVRKAIGLFLETIHPPKIYRRAPLRMVVVKNGMELRVQQLSDGEKCLLAMIGDLARRLAIANPSLDNPLEGEGVVLIDEIDLHLHPQWQRMILPKLAETFPNCQFIVSTHSPQILGEIRSENVIRLEMTESGIEAFPSDNGEVFGMSSNMILTTQMDSVERDQTVQKLIDQIFTDIERGKLDKARKNKVELEKIARDIPELVKINMLINLKEIENETNYQTRAGRIPTMEIKPTITAGLG